MTQPHDPREASRLPLPDISVPAALEERTLAEARLALAEGGPGARARRPGALGGGHPWAFAAAACVTLSYGAWALLAANALLT